MGNIYTFRRKKLQCDVSGRVMFNEDNHMEKLLLNRSTTWIEKGNALTSSLLWFPDWLNQVIIGLAFSSKRTCNCISYSSIKPWTLGWVHSSSCPLCNKRSPRPYGLYCQTRSQNDWNISARSVAYFYSCHFDMGAGQDRGYRDFTWSHSKWSWTFYATIQTAQPSQRKSIILHLTSAIEPSYRDT